MSLSAVKNAIPANVNHPAHQTQRAPHHQHEQPSVQNAQGRLHPTQVEKAMQLSGNHIEVQKLDSQSKVSNPSSEQSRFNAKVATSGV